MATPPTGRPVFGSGVVGGQDGSGDRVDYAAIQRTPEFQALRRKRRLFVFPMTAIFMAWFLVYVLLSAYARDFMATPVLGLINIGIVMGLGQFVSTLLIMVAYCRYADRVLDPLADELRERAENRS